MDVQPFVAAWRKLDLDVMADALSADVVLYSPIIRRPFIGRESAVELFGVLFDTLGDFEVIHEFVDGDAGSIVWRADAGGRRIEGVDLLRSGDDGRIIEARVSIRPLVDIAAFAAAVGPRLAGKRGPLRAALTRSMTLVLKGFLTMSDAIGSRLVQRR